MMKYFRLFCVVTCLFFVASSCITPREVDYLQDIKPNEAIPLNSKLEAVICPNDQLQIQVTGYGDEKELAEPFNLTMNNNAGTMSYLVDVNGNIQFPTFGMLHVQGLTRLQLQELIKNKLVEMRYMNNPIVEVKFLNFRIFVLGTTDGGKVLTINNERCTFLEALAMMGGLDKYTKRDKIAVMREIDGKMVTRYLDPRSSEVFNDPFFMLQQNDIIITQAFRRTYSNEWLNNGLTIFSSVISLASTITMLYFLIKQ